MNRSLTLAGAVLAAVLATAAPAYATTSLEPTTSPVPTTSVAPTTDPPTSVTSPTDDPTSSTTEPTSPTSTEPTSSSTTTAPTTSTTPATTTTSTTTTTTAPVEYENCAAVHAAGHPFLLRHEPGYRPALDRDNDGIACEWREDGKRDDKDRHPGSRDDDSDDSWCTDHDHRTLIFYIPGRDGEDGEDGEDGKDGEDGSDGFSTISDGTSSRIADVDATYTQWPTVPDGGIATGSA